MSERKTSSPDSSDSTDQPPLCIREARSDTDYHRAYPIIRQLLPDLDLQTYVTRVFVARATGYLFSPTVCW